MDVQRMDAREARARWRDVLDKASAGKAVVVQRHGRPVAAVISFADFEAVREELEDLADLRLAEAVLREIERDPSRLVPLEQLEAELEAEDESDDRPEAMAG